ncbi:MAG: NosD domain-containing protein, partial [Ignavibacteria bacterium]
GIVLEEEHTVNNILANNTTDNNSEDGIYLYDNTSKNILTGNNARNNDDYGIHLHSASSNTLYLNNLISNTIGNVLSENGSTNSWCSSTTIYYDYNSGTFHKGYLGNYYSDGTHSGSNGIGGTYTIANDNNDDYQLTDTIDFYSLQAWWIHSDDNMYCDDATQTGGSITISSGGNHIWASDEAAETSTNFVNSDTWTGYLVFSSAPVNGHTFTVEIGYSTDGNDFTSGGPDATVTGDGSSTEFIFTTDADDFTVSTGNYLACRITSNDAEYTIRTGGAWSYISSPDNSENYAFPVELSSFTATVSGGIVTLNWQTETEVNNYGFDVERKQNNDWQKIGFVEGFGNSNSPKNYSFEDSNPGGTGIFYYRLKQIDNGGAFEYSDIIEVFLTGETGYVLGQNYPNPFNPVTTIRYHVPSDVSGDKLDVSLIVYDILGNEIAILVNEEQPAGEYEVQFSKGMVNQTLSSGVYFYRLTAGEFSQIKKMILMK